jgi:dephospho-CoA kinase
MKMFYVTGISGSGKSRVREELSKRGYLAYDGDENGITAWQDKMTGEFVDTSERTPGPNGSPSELYDWHMSQKRLEELALESDDQDLFICGTASNRYDLWNMFEKVFCLSVDEETLVQRLKTRTSNDFGKDPNELKDVLSWHKPSEQTDLEMGAISIDATQPIEEVVDEILKHAV